RVKASTPHQIQQGTPAFSFGDTFRTRTRCIVVYVQCLPEVSFGSNAGKTGANPASAASRESLPGPLPVRAGVHTSRPFEKRYKTRYAGTSSPMCLLECSSLR